MDEKVTCNLMVEVVSLSCSELDKLFKTQFYFIVCVLQINSAEFITSLNTFCPSGYMTIIQIYNCAPYMYASSIVRLSANQIAVKFA